MPDELQQLQKEINQLKKKKERKLMLSKSTNERNQLLKEINELEAIKKKPSLLKSFGQTYLKGLKITGRSIWKAIQKGSRNLERNAPEFKEMAQRKPSNQPFSNLGMTYLPKVKSKTKKIPKKKKKSRAKSKRVMNQPMAWDLP